MDITSSNWYSGAANHIWTMNAAPNGVQESAFTLLAINLESGLSMAIEVFSIEWFTPLL